jgi:hypothetical protein
MQTSFAVWVPVSTLKYTLIGHVGLQPLTMDSRSNPTPEGFEPLTKSSRSKSPTNCTLTAPWLMLLKELRRWEEDTNCLGLAAAPPNVHLKAKAGKVPVDEFHAFQEAVPCIKREGSIINIEALNYFVGTESLGLEHF